MTGPHPATALAAAVLAMALPLVTSWAQAIVLAVSLALIGYAAWSLARRRRGRGPVGADRAADRARLHDADPRRIEFRAVPTGTDDQGRPSRWRVEESDGGGLANVGMTVGEAVGSFVDDWPAEDTEHYRDALRSGSAAWTQPYPTDPRDLASAPRAFDYFAVRDGRGGLLVRVLDVTDLAADLATAEANAEAAAHAAAHAERRARDAEEDARLAREAHAADRRLWRAQTAGTNGTASSDQ